MLGRKRSRDLAEDPLHDLDVAAAVFFFAPTRWGASMDYADGGDSPGHSFCRPALTAASLRLSSVSDI